MAYFKFLQTSLVVWAVSFPVVASAGTTFEGLPYLGGTNGMAYALSADGKAVVGTSENALGETQIFYWQNGVITELSLGGAFGYSSYISADGSTVVGASQNALGEYQAFYWKDGVISQLSLGGTSGTAYGVSADGSAVAGESRNALGQSHAFYWKNGVITQLSLGGTSGTAQAISADGSAVVGQSRNGLGQGQAFHWQNGVITQLSLGGTSGSSSLVSSDGSAVAGVSQNSLGQSQAFYWKNGVITQLSLGGTNGNPKAISADGSAVVGSSRNALGQYQAFHWQNGTMTQISLGGTVGGANAVSADGTAVIGVSRNVSGQSQAFYWQNGNMTELSLGGADGEAMLLSVDGSVVAGRSQDALGQSQIFRWTEADGIKSVQQILADAHVDMTGWDLSYNWNTLLLSADGSVIASTGLHNGNQQVYLMTMGGLITPEELVESTAPVAQQSKQAESAVVDSVSQSLMVARNAITGYFPRVNAYTLENNRQTTSNALNNYAPAAGGLNFTPINQKRRAFYALGNYGAGQNNNFANDNSGGSAGVLFEVADSLIIGGGGVGSVSNIETRLGGHNRSEAWGGNILAAYEPPSGLRLYGAVTAAALDMDTRRHYINGSGIDSSKGNTDGMGYGVAVRGGYEMPITNQTAWMPYTEWQVSHSRIKGYTETGGGFPVTVGDQNNTMVTSRFGTEVSHDLTHDLTIRGRGAWGHRYTESGPAAVTTIGLTQILPGSDGDRDWAEIGTTINYRVTDRMTISADVVGRTSKTAEPAVNATIGLIWRW